jgi:spermidine dehydrogenase
MNVTRKNPAGSAAGDITRRDFLNGVLIAAGGAAVGQSSPLRAFAAEAEDPCADVAGADPRAIRGGNSPSVIRVGHWLRDQRLKFESSTVTLAPGCDGKEGRFPIAADRDDYDVIVAGGGLAGLSSAFYLLRRRPGTRILVLEANPFAGGNASCDDQAPMPVAASTCGAYSAFPDSGHLKELYRETGVDWERYPIPSPIDSYYFDEMTPGVRPGMRGWRIDFLSDLTKQEDIGSIENPPYERRVMEDLARAIRDFMSWHSKPGAPEEPPDLSSPSYDDLSTMSFAQYITDVLHCDPTVVDFFKPYTADCMGGPPKFVNAHTVLSFLNSDYRIPCFAYPGGTAQIARQLLAWLAAPKEGDPTSPRIELRTQSTVLGVEADVRSAGNKVGVVYFDGATFKRARAKLLVMAVQAQSARRLVEHLADDEQKAAWNEIKTAPAAVANVALRTMAPFVDAGLGYSNYWWGSKDWGNLIIADWTTERRNIPERASAITLYGGVNVAPEDLPAERMRLLSTPFASYEQSLKDDLSRIMRGTGFDFERDVAGVFLYRWGHSMILPSTRSIFGSVRGPDGRLDRSRAPRRVACRPVGPILFAGQYTEGSPSVESAVASGYRAALEAMARL